MHKIAPDGKLRVESSHEGTVTEFKLDEKKMASRSQYFENNLKFNRLSGRSDLKITLDGDDPKALFIWFSYFHANDDIKWNELWSAPAIKNASIADIWELVVVGDKYNFDGKILEQFLTKWFPKNVKLDRCEDVEEALKKARGLAFPCFIFDYAKGFADITKFLAYNHVGHITEKRPDGFECEHYHLMAKDFVGPLNAARGRLKTVLNQGLCERSDNLLERGKVLCTCGKYRDTIGRYLEELYRLKAYPLEKRLLKFSINEILDRLPAFQWEQVSRCHVCSPNWKYIVDWAKKKTERYFDGICIDCMDKSKPKRDNTDQDYWQHCKSVDGRWDTGCRIAHDEPTWYHSWCGRDEHRQKLLEMSRSRN